MKTLKITNWLTPRGNADYKGLNIDLIVPGSQIYLDGVCYIQTDEPDIPEHGDIEEVTQEEYKAAITNIPTPVDPLEELRNENKELKQAIAEITMTIAAMMGGN